MLHSTGQHLSANKGSAELANVSSKRQSVNTVTLDEKKEHLSEFKTETATYRKVANVFELPSTVESPSDQTGAVFALVNGVVTRILVDVGDPVKAGQVIAYINSPDLGEAQSAHLNALDKLDETRAQVKLLKTRLKLANSDELRLESLLNEGISARRDLENSQSRVAVTAAELVAAQNSVHAATAALRAARSKLASLGLPEPRRETESFTSELAVRSPIKGTVTQRNVHPGQSVGPALGSGSGKSLTLFTIAQLNKVWVMVEAPQSVVTFLKLGSPVEFRSEVAPGQHFVGKVTRLGEHFDPESRTGHVRTEIENRLGLLKPGMLVIATLSELDEHSKQLAVPVSALQSIYGHQCVFVALGNHKYEKRAVVLGNRTASLAVVKNGVSAGESVVTNGSFYLKSEVLKSAIGAAD